MIIQHYTWTQNQVKERPVIRNDIDVNEHDYPTLHLDTKSSKGTACSKKGYRCK